MGLLGQTSTQSYEWARFLLLRPLDPSNSFHGKVAVIRRLAGYANAPTNHSLGSNPVHRGRCGLSRCRTVSHRSRARTQSPAEAQGCGDRTGGMKDHVDSFYVAVAVGAIFIMIAILFWLQFTD
jgi:hypothetical protein